jgi:hypothetical protein
MGRSPMPHRRAVRDIERFAIAWRLSTSWTDVHDTLSMDLREKILQAYDQDFGSQRALAVLCGVSRSCVEKLRQRRRTTGEMAPRPHAGGRRPCGDAPTVALVS